MPAQAKQIDHDPCVQTDSQQPMLHQDFQISVMQKEFFLMTSSTRLASSGCISRMPQPKTGFSRNISHPARYIATRNSTGLCSSNRSAIELPGLQNVNMVEITNVAATIKPRHAYCTRLFDENIITITN